MSNTPSPIDLAVEAALERLASDAEGQRWANAYRRAADHYRAGVRPIALPEKWLVPSASQAGVWYEVARRGDRCACRAGSSGCWHAALAIGVELSYEYLDAGLVGAAEPEPEPATLSIGQRIARARAERVVDMQTW